jgi:diguanylate cyclase (GGDEF)-like protein
VVGESVQVLSNIQKNLTRVVIFNRIFSFSMLVILAMYLVQLNSSINLIPVVLLIFALVGLIFHALLIEVIGQIIRKKTILTSEICDWIGKVITISIGVVVTVSCLLTGNLFLASFFVLPIVIGSFLGDFFLKRIGVFAILFVLIFQHTGLTKSNLLIHNNVGYEPASIIQAILILNVVLLAGVIVSNSKQTHQKTNILQSMATTDVLTGLINRRYFDRRLAEEIARSSRHTANLSLALFDIDHFKRVNDTYGHTIGDRILQELGEIILKNTRECDISARYGGEEFALILPETTQIEASELLERIRQLVENHTFAMDDMPIMITISVGIAQYDPAYTPKDFIDQADAALYRAKRTGRNKVIYGTFTTPKLNLQKIT